MTTNTTKNTDEIRFRRVKTGEWVLSGPADIIEAAVASGSKLTVSKKSGGERHLTPLRHGRRFTEDGIEKCYGYTTEILTCSACNTELPKRARFCPSCGEGVVSGTTQNDSQGEGGFKEHQLPDTWSLVEQHIQRLTEGDVR